MSRKQEMGVPLPFGAALKPEMIVATAGDFDQDDGMKIVLSDGNLVVMGAFDSITVSMGVRIEDILEAICAYNKETGN